MNDQQILEFVATKQPVRAVQLADKFDVDLKAASDALRSLVDVGDLTRANGTAPNGQPAQIYGLSEAFVKSREGKLLAARIEVAQAALAAAIAAPVAKVEPDEVPLASAAPIPEQEAPSDPPTPSGGAAGPTGINRAEAGVAHILKHGSVSDADLRQVMGLRAGQYPSAWLGAAVKRGDVNKNGKNWTPGPGVEIRKQPAFGGSLGLAGATPKPQASPSEPVNRTEDTVKPKHGAPPVDAKAQQPSREPAAPATVTFRCGLWSDGTLELQRNGVTVAELHEGEGATVAAFMARLSLPSTAAA